MDSIHEYLQYLSFFVWISLTSVLLYHWCRGLIDSKSMMKFLFIICAIGCGYFIFQQIISNTSDGSQGQQISCYLMNEAYYSCGGWPIFYPENVSSLSDLNPDQRPEDSLILRVAKLVVLSINNFSGFSAGYAQIIAACVLYSKFIKGLWSGSIKEILFSFFGGAIIYISLSQSAHIEEMFMDMTMYLVGFTNHHGDSNNVVTEVVKTLANWNSSVKNVIAIQKDASLFSFDFLKALPQTLISYSLYLVLQLPLLWFSILNIIMMSMQQFLLLTLPIDAIKMTMSINVDPLLVLRKLFAISMLSIAVVSEFKILSWIPDPPFAKIASIGVVGAGIYVGFFWSCVVILGLVILGTLFSTIVIFKSFNAGKESVERLA